MEPIEINYTGDTKTVRLPGKAILVSVNSEPESGNVPRWKRAILKLFLRVWL